MKKDIVTNKEIKEVEENTISKKQTVTSKKQQTVAQLKQEVRSYQRAIDEALFILCQGRTFYEGYFDNYDNLGRIDKAIFVLSKVIRPQVLREVTQIVNTMSDVPKNYQNN